MCVFLTFEIFSDVKKKYVSVTRIPLSPSPPCPPTDFVEIIEISMRGETLNRMFTRVVRTTRTHSTRLFTDGIYYNFFELCFFFFFLPILFVLLLLYALVFLFSPLFMYFISDRNNGFHVVNIHWARIRMPVNVPRRRFVCDYCFSFQTPPRVTTNSVVL